MVSAVPRLDEYPTRADPLLGDAEGASDCVVGTAGRLASACCQLLIVGVLAVQALKQETASAAAKAAGARPFRSPDIQCPVHECVVVQATGISTPVSQVAYTPCLRSRIRPLPAELKPGRRPAIEGA